MTREKRLTVLRTARNQKSKRKARLVRKGGVLQGKHFGILTPGWKKRFQLAQKETEKRNLRGIKAEVSKVAKIEARKPNVLQRLFSRRGK